ncbi:MAG: PAS domain S-box protein [Proteobacteria bacterium]|nr:PAS domain S-box protein [Pseudomonadota bacterium]
MSTPKKPKFGGAGSASGQAADSLPDQWGDLTAPDGAIREIFDDSPVGFLMHRDGYIVYGNNAIAEIFGYSLEKLIGLEIWQLFPPEEVPRLKKMAEARAQGEIAPLRYETIGQRPDGTRRIVELAVRYGHWRGRGVYQSFVTDRTIEREAEAALAESDRMFRDLVDGSIQGFYVHRDFKILYANRAAAEIFGYLPEQFNGIYIEDFVHPSFRARQLEIRRKRLSGESAPDRYEFLGLKRDGAPVWIEIMSRVVEWQGEEAIQSTIVDINARKEIDVSLRRAKEEAEQANRAKTQFLANMSHELRTPLNAIIGFSQLIRDGVMGPIPDKYAEYAGLVHSSGDHLLALINDLLDIAAIEAGEMRTTEMPVDLGAAIDACVRMLRGRAQKAGLRLAHDVPTPAPVVRSDERRVQQILINLIGNAIKFTPEGGMIDVRLSKAGGVIILEIIDTGIGIPAEEIDRVFNPFARAGNFQVSQKEGTGLGLPLVRSLSAILGISVDLQSGLGKGTKVTLSFPAHLQTT